MRRPSVLTTFLTSADWGVGCRGSSIQSQLRPRPPGTSTLSGTLPSGGHQQALYGSIYQARAYVRSEKHRTCATTAHWGTCSDTPAFARQHADMLNPRAAKRGGGIPVCGRYAARRQGTPRGGLKVLYNRQGSLKADRAAPQLDQIARRISEATPECSPTTAAARRHAAVTQREP